MKAARGKGGLFSFDPQFRLDIPTTGRNMQLRPSPGSIFRSGGVMPPPQTQQSGLHPIVPLNNILLPLERHPKILGVTFDPHLCFHKHVNNIVERAKPRLSILKALCGTSWGQDKETLITTFKALIDSLFMYAAPVWFPNTSSSSIQKMQRIQNSALRIATGCVRMSPIDHLHTESRVLKVVDHLKMICSQFLATSLHPNHVSYPIVTADSGPQDKKATLQTRCLDQVAHLMDDGHILDSKAARKDIHTRAVENAIQESSDNPVLGAPAPEVNFEERELQRATRTTLAQLRSGYCSSLNEYRERTGLSDTPVCPCCRQAPHSVHRIFDCPSHPTDLTPLDMWRHPREVGRFLSTWPCFNIPDEDRHHPEPPSERPPPEPPPSRHHGESGRL